MLKKRQCTTNYRQRDISRFTAAQTGKCLTACDSHVQCQLPGEIEHVGFRTRPSQSLLTSSCRVGTLLSVEKLLSLASAWVRERELPNQWAAWAMKIAEPYVLLIVGVSDLCNKITVYPKKTRVSLYSMLAGHRLFPSGCALLLSKQVVRLGKPFEPALYLAIENWNWH